jgi:zinc protease
VFRTSPRDDLCAFRDRHIVGSNGVLAVFGSVKADEVRRLIERELESLKKASLRCKRLLNPSLSPGDGVVEHRPKQQAVLMTGFHGIDLANPDRAALELIDEACSDLGSRLFLRIASRWGWRTSSGPVKLVGLVRGAFTFYLGTDPAKVEEVKVALQRRNCSPCCGWLTDAETRPGQGEADRGAGHPKPEQRCIRILVRAR